MSNVSQKKGISRKGIYCKTLTRSTARRGSADSAFPFGLGGSKNDCADRELHNSYSWLEADIGSKTTCLF